MLLLLVTVAFGQDSQPGTKGMPEPRLPVVEITRCLVNARTSVPIKAESPLYSTWQNGRTKIAVLKAKDTVALLGGFTITLVPDKIVVTKPMSELDLKSGDIILRYQSLGEGEANFWTKGVWHEDGNLWTTIEKNGGGCRAVDTCNSKVIEDGIQERWVQVKTHSGSIGWVLEFKNTHGAYYFNAVFGQLCAG
jgi:hypothetical protein